MDGTAFQTVENGDQVVDDRRGRREASASRRELKPRAKEESCGYVRIGLHLQRMDTFEKDSGVQYQSRRRRRRGEKMPKRQLIQVY